MNMNTRYIFTLFGFLLFLGYSFTATAQHEQILKPQEASEIALYKALKVKIEKQEVVSNVNYNRGNRIRMFDPNGRVIGNFDFYNRKYYRYDQEGRVAGLLDSVNNEDEKNTFRGTPFSVQYGDNKFPKMIIGGNASYTFDWNAEDRLLTETSTTDTPARSIYKYNMQGNLVDAKYFDAAGRVLEHRAIFYNKNQKSRENLVNYFEDAVDSTSEFFFYDDDHGGRLATKQVFKHNTWVVEKDTAGRATNTASKNDAGIYTYTYDKKGQLVKEEFKSSVSEFKNTMTLYSYYDNGLIKRVSERTGKLPPEIVEYSYIFYE